ncbi:beta-lactamase [Auricularia subglabra TFB-10046 SS5]|uniref:Beta-lactamase n=1 Tax=Auricularia subglabra (strain TFB-10046 / SS5) TaxID=717982 RepID=J0DA94_AURST|nr:beta-lactamase [Auricularia subglabra TFB-10046 SS5]
MSLAADVQSILKKAVTAPNGPAGLVYGAIDAKGSTLVLEAAGLRALGGEEPMTTDAFFALCSMTKLLTTIAAMQLVEQGKLALDDPIHAILPEIRAVGQLMPDGSVSTPARPEHTEKITLRMLLTHTAGFGYAIFHPQLAAYQRASGGSDELSGLREGTLGLPLAHEPGTRWMYSIGVDWAGEAVSRVSGLRLGDYLKQNLFAPLGIDEEITFHLTPDQAGLLAAMHGRGEDGVLQVMDHPPFVHDAPWESGGGGAIGTLRAYLTVLAVLLNGGVGPNGARILTEDTVKSMFINQVPEGMPGLGETIIPGRPELTYPVTTPPGVRTGWGLSFELNLASTSPPGDPLPSGRSAHTGAWAGLANLYYTVDPTKGVATLIMSQSVPFFDPAVTGPFLEAEKAVYASIN